MDTCNTAGVFGFINSFRVSVSGKCSIVLMLTFSLTSLFSFPIIKMERDNVRDRPMPLNRILDTMRKFISFSVSLVCFFLESIIRKREKRSKTEC